MAERVRPVGRASRRRIWNVVRTTISAQIIEKKRHSAEQGDLAGDDPGLGTPVVAVSTVDVWCKRLGLRYKKSRSRRPNNSGRT